MSLLVTNVGEIELLKRVLYGNAGAVTGATNATPIVVTSTAHGLSNGQCVTISGVGGNTAANGTFTVGSVAANTFSLFTTATGTGGAGVAGNGAYTSGGTWTIAGMETATLKLYQNNHTPAESDVAGGYTVATFTGYADKTLTSTQAAATWAVPTTVAPTGAWAPAGNTNVAESTYGGGAAQTWSPSTSQTVYGYYVVGANSTTLWFAELFASAKNLVNGDTLNLTPRLGCAHS